MAAPGQLAPATRAPTRLLTPRLLLRQAEATDLHDYCTCIYADPSVMRTLPGRVPVAPAAAGARARQHLVEHWHRHGFGPWLVYYHDDPRVLGHCGLRYWPDSDDVEVLYALRASAWGQGLATEAARASLRIGFETLTLPRIIAGAFADNLGSLRVLEKLGMRHWQRQDFAGEAVEMYQITRAHWLRAAAAQRRPYKGRSQHA